MLDSFYIGATGMGTQQARLNAISNNIANVNTPAFKKGRVAFEDLFYRRLSAATEANPEVPSTQVGLGVALSRTDTVFTAGDLVKTDNTLDIAIKGNGFLEIEDASGVRYYSRAGSLRLDEDGNLLTANGNRLAGNIRVPADAVELKIATDGTVTALSSRDGKAITLGQLELANFVNPGGLRPLGGGLYAATDLSGQAYLAVPGEEGVGTIEQGFVESSNVDLTSELVELVLAQKAYQLNSRVVQISDDILNTITNLRG